MDRISVTGSTILAEPLEELNRVCANSLCSISKVIVLAISLQFEEKRNQVTPTAQDDG